MKNITKLLFAIVALLLAACSKTQSPAVAVSSQQRLNAKWYELGDGDNYIADFSLEAGGRKPIEFLSDDPLFIGFKTDASVEVVKRYLETKPSPVRLEVTGLRFFAKNGRPIFGKFSASDSVL